MSAETKVVLSVWVFAGIFGFAACTQQQRQHARTALEVNRCVTTISLRHIDAGDDFKDPLVSARMAAEIVDECSPFVREPKD